MILMTLYKGLTVLVKNVVNMVKIKKFVKIKSLNLCPVELINMDELIMV